MESVNLLKLPRLNDLHSHLFRPYSRHSAAYPTSWLLERKFWPTVSRIDDGVSVAYCSLIPADCYAFDLAYGDLNLIVGLARTSKLT